jgi:hypothetical protein
MVKTKACIMFRAGLETLSALDKVIKWCPCNYLSTVLLKKIVAKSLII